MLQNRNVRRVVQGQFRRTEKWRIDSQTPPGFRDFRIVRRKDHPVDTPRRQRGLRRVSQQRTPQE